MDVEIRSDLAILFGDRIKPLVAHFRRESEVGSTYNSDLVFPVTDPWREKEKKVSHTGVVF